MDTEKLLQILEIQTTTYSQFRMFAYLIREAYKIPGCSFYTNKGNLYITKGDNNNYPCIVAHMDTVHDICEDLIAIKIGQNVTGFNRYTMEQTGIGGDDKVGIFIALECLNFFEHIKVAFFRDEESGCEGSNEADTTFFEDTNFVLQCDRQGCEDFITEIGGVKLSSQNFQSEIAHILKQYGYSFSRGLMTDVMALKELQIPCSMANISCGYYSPHTNHEYVNLVDVENCLNLVKSILNEIGQIQYPHIYKKPKNYLPNFRFHGRSAYCLDCYAPNPTRTGYCELCNEYYQFMER